MRIVRDTPGSFVVSAKPICEAGPHTGATLAVNLEDRQMGENAWLLASLLELKVLAARLESLTSILGVASTQTSSSTAQASSGQMAVLESLRLCSASMNRAYLRYVSMIGPSSEPLGQLERPLRPVSQPLKPGLPTTGSSGAVKPVAKPGNSV